MIRILLDRAFDNERHYIHAVGLSTDMKPTTGIITGSKFVAVDTGAGYLFDETAGEWNENTQLSEAVAAYLDEHPEAIDQAAIEALFGDQLDGIEEDISGLKSALTSTMRVESINVLANTTWEIGTLNSSDGSNLAAINRIRTIGYIDLHSIDELTFAIASGYKFVIDWYDENYIANKATPFGSWNTSNLTISVPDNVSYMRLLVADTANGTADTNYSQYLTCMAKYVLLNKIGEIDSKIEEEDEKTRQEIKYITDNNPPYKRMIIELEMGGYDSSGEEQEDTKGTRWRTPNYIYVSNLAYTEIIVPTGYVMYVCCYGEGNEFIIRGTWNSGSTHDVKNYYSIRYTIVKSSWTPMTEEEADAVLIKQKIPWYEYLANGVNPLNVYPDYYDTQIKSVAANFTNDLLSVGANGDGFVFMSDVHWNGNYKHSPNLIYYLKENTNLNLILCGGDLIDRSTSSKSSQIEDMQNCIKAFKQIGIPFLTAIGNHERNSSGVSDSSLYLSEEEVFSITQNPVNWMPLNYAEFNDRICFYYDKTATKTRYIFIDSGQNNIGTFDITTDEISWVETVIGNTQSDYHIIVIVHSLGEYQSLNSPVSESNPFVYTSGATSLLESLDSLLPLHKIEAVFVGHTHVDNNAETTGGIPIVWVNSDAKWQYHGMTQPTDGTVDAQCFDVVTMDYTNKRIILRRVGRGSDRIINYGE